MRRILFFLLLIPSLLTARDPFVMNQHLKALLDSGEYFRFRTEFHHLAMLDTLGDPGGILYFGAWSEHLFGNPVKSNECISRLVDPEQFETSDSVKAELLQLHLQNDLRLFQYRAADSICSVLLFRYPDVIHPQALDEIRNFAGIARGLKDVPPQTVTRSGDLEVPFKRDIANLIRVPVTMNGKAQKFIFDTGANLSTICESEAKRMGVRILDATFGVASSSHSSVDARLGVADEMKIGNATFHNVVFIVLPDQSLKFIAGLYKIKGIVGIPVIAQLGEIQVRKNGRLFSPAQQTEASEFNLGMSGNTPFADISFYGESHPYIFDTGAATSIFTTPFLHAYRDSLVDPEEQTTKVGGAGGMHTLKVIKTGRLPYSFGGQQGILKNATIQQSSTSKVYSIFFGIAGEDIFMQWETMTINFDRHFVLFR